MNTTPTQRQGFLRRRFLSRGALLGAALLATPLLLAPAIALAAPLQVPVAAENEADSCAVTGGTLTWGTKESFRSYISGSIANGSWEATDGARYSTPEFQWSKATGSINPSTGLGTVSFQGTVHFTGHSGVLDLTFANPTIEFEEGGKASLLMDARSNDATGKLVVDAEQEWVGDVTAPTDITAEADTLTFSKMKTVLTNGGAKAFAGFYEAGAELDPITVTLDFPGCDLSKVTAAVPTANPADPDTTSTPAATTGEGPEVPWIPIVIGAVAILVIGVTAGMLLSGRKRPQAAQDPAAQDSAE